MHKMSNLEYSFMVRELAGLLVGKHFSRIRKLGESVYRMKIGTIEIVCELGVRIHATRYLEAAEETEKFTEKISKELDNARLLAIEQPNQDRIVSFVFDRASFVFEMFGEGNAILVCDGKTVCAHKYESWSDREIKAGSGYSLPKSVPLEKPEFSDKYVAVSLMKLPLGKQYVLEALARAGIGEKTQGDKLMQPERAKLELALADIKNNPAPLVFHDAAGKPVDFALAPLSAYSSLEKKEFVSLSEAADEYYMHAEKPNPKLEKLLKRLEKQEERLAGLKEEEKESKAKGDLIYERYVEIEQILSAAKSGKFEEIEKNYKGKTDKKEKSVEVEL